MSVLIKFLFVIIVITSSLSSVGRTASFFDKQQELEYLNRQKNETRQMLQETTAKERNVLQELTILRAKLNEGNKQIDYVQGRILQNQTAIVTLKSELGMLSAQLQTHLNNFQQRICSIYKSEYLGYLAFFFELDSFNTVVDNAYILEKIMQSDQQLLGNIRNRYNGIVDKQRQLKYKQDELRDVRGELQKKQGVITNLQTMKNSYAQKLAKEKTLYEKKLSELDRNSKEIEQLLSNLETTATYGTTSYVWPAYGWISSGYGNRIHPIFKNAHFHSGLDIAAPRGDRIVAADSGRVIFANWWGGYGKATIIDHGRGITTVYAHQSRIAVKEGQFVNKGETIGYIGSTGNSTGPHLHFEVRQLGKTLDPQRFLPAR